MAEHNNCDHCGQDVGIFHDTDWQAVWCVQCFLDSAEVLRKLDWEAFDIERHILEHSNPDNTAKYLRWTYPHNVENLKKIPPKNSQTTFTFTAHPNPTAEQEVVAAVPELCKKCYYGIGIHSCRRS